ncbi:MAG TPA: hypothetical protein VJV78_46370 [Polyangiales bacterium]|nr:hypothetical protein [Polyangiales bacterium]
MTSVWQRIGSTTFLLSNSRSARSSADGVLTPCLLIESRRSGIDGPLYRGLSTPISGMLRRAHANFRLPALKLSQVDLNLLVALDALLRERNELAKSASCRFKLQRGTGLADRGLDADDGTTWHGEQPMKPQRVLWFASCALACLACGEARRPNASVAEKDAGVTAPVGDDRELDPTPTTPIVTPATPVDAGPAPAAEPTPSSIWRGRARTTCVDGRCTCPTPDQPCDGTCESLDDAGTDTCARGREEVPSGCAPSGCPAISAITAGSLHTCILLEDHTVMCWGMNTLGENSVTAAKKTPPELVEGLSDVRIYEAGDTHTCFVRSSGPAQCFGINYTGELGDGTKNSSATPVAVKLEGKPIGFGLGDSHSCALLSDGSVQCWGMLVYVGEASTTPQPVPGLQNVKSISSRARQNCVLLTDKTVQCWSVMRVAPQPVENLDNVASVATGEYRACALLLDGTVKCWPSEKLVAATVPGVRDATSIASGNESTCVVLRDRTVQCWGQNRAGELGDGITAGSETPVRVPGIEDVKLLAAGGGHFCAVKQDNSVRCWGGNNTYQLGNGRTEYSNLPVAVLFPRD